MILNTQITLGKAKTDSYIDACGYIACAGEIATRREVGTETDDKLKEIENAVQKAMAVFGAGGEK